jgi:tetratricopeptide (TPR) repeat protein
VTNGTSKTHISTCELILSRSVFSARVGSDTVPYFFFLQVEKERNKDYDAPDTGYEKNITTAQILETAKWTGFEENSRFHERVASTILAFWEVDNAIKYYQKAIEMDANNWKAHAGLAKSYEDRGEWELAIESMDKALQQFEDDPLVKLGFKEDYDDFTYLLARWHENCGRNEKALELFRCVHNSDKMDFEAAFRILKILTAEEKYGEIIEFLQDMESEDHTIHSDMTRLDDCHFEYFEEDAFHEMTVLAARKTGNLMILQKAYIRAIKAADVRSKTIVSGCLRQWYGRLLLHEFGSQEQAATVFEDVMKMTASSSNDGASGWARFQSGKRLAMIYIDRATKAGPGTPEAKTNIQKIAQLSVGRTSDDDDEARMNMMTNTTSTINITLVLGRWYAKEEKNDKEAREHFVSHIRLGIDLLSDSNPYNDPDAYKKLGYAFMHYGDDVNALAAWSLLGPIEQPSIPPSPPLSASEPSVHSGQDGGKKDDDNALLSTVEEEQSGLTITEKTTKDLENGDIKVLEVTTDISIKESVIPTPDATTQTEEAPNGHLEATPTLMTKGDPPGSFPPETPANDEEDVFMTPIEPSRRLTEVFPQPSQSEQISNDDNPQVPLRILTSNDVSAVDKDTSSSPTLEEQPKEDPEVPEALPPHDSAPPPTDAVTPKNDNFPPLPRSALTTPPAPPSPPLDPNDFSRESGNLDLGCDGRCGKGWRIADDIHLCRICIDTGFCGDCLQKCKDGKLGFSMCNPEHEWFHIPKATSRLPVGKVRVGGFDGVDGVEGELMGIEEWKEGIRRDWGL